MIDLLNAQTVLERLDDRCKNLISLNELVVVFHDLKKTL